MRLRETCRRRGAGRSWVTAGESGRVRALKPRLERLSSSYITRTARQSTRRSTARTTERHSERLTPARYGWGRAVQPDIGSICQRWAAQ